MVKYLNKKLITGIKINKAALTIQRNAKRWIHYLRFRRKKSFILVQVKKNYIQRLIKVRMFLSDKRQSSL